MNPIDAIFYIAILIMSVVIHEVSHGFMAEYFGDKTARYAGRLTMNPIKHLDPWGSVILPAILVLANSPFLIGWAKPVPYNPNNLSNEKWGTIAVASAGILANIFIAVVFGTLLRFSFELGLPKEFTYIASVIVLLNLGLAVFNLVPIPPLDGSKIVFSVLPRSAAPMMAFMEQYAFVFIIGFVVLFSKFLVPVIGYAFELITGFSIGF